MLSLVKSRYRTAASRLSFQEITLSGIGRHKLKQQGDTIVIKVHTGIGFDDLLPGSSAESPVEMEVASGTQLEAVAALAGLQPGEKFMMALNGTVVVKSERGHTQLADGDAVEILPPLTGG